MRHQKRGRLPSVLLGVQRSRVRISPSRPFFSSIEFLKMSEPTKKPFFLFTEPEQKRPWFSTAASTLMLILWPVPLIVILLIWS